MMNDSGDPPAPPAPRRQLDPCEIRRCMKQLLQDVDGIRADSVLVNGMTAGEFCMRYLQKIDKARRMKRGGGDACT